MKRMRNAVVAILILLLTVASLQPIAGAETTENSAISKAELQRMYTEYLIGEGYKPEIDKDGDIVFKREGRSYIIIIKEKDPEFFQLILPNFWAIESEEERARVLVAADASNAKSKYSKIYTVKDNVWVSMELFVEKPDDFKQLFGRAMAALANGLTNFVSKMREK
ncbi:MAG: hypothetical protein P9M08_05995 [Candidatus Erginobacter occultus]|nr:hypothetical protein [Candidatus Erginobacter occultus]